MLMDNYRENWVKFQENVDYYYEVRDKFNETKDHFLYYFLTRTSYNGGIRFNSKGEFNMPCHFGRPGIHPDKLDEIITYHHNLMRGLDINLSVSSYEGHFGKNGDIIYSDPPYGKTKKGQLYKNVIDMDKFKEWASNLNCDLFLNLGGTNSKYDDDVIPKEFYDEKIIMESGNSSFSRLKNLNSVVQEYFYIKRNKKKII